MDSLANCGEGIVIALNVQTYGNGTRTIVLSHGFGSDQSAWHYLVPALALCFKVLVFDLVISPNVNPDLYDPVRYSSFSAYAQDLTCILDHFHVKNCIFIGHSMSAMIGCVAAAERPDLFQHLILLSASPRYLNATSYKGGFNRAGLESLFDSMKSNYSSWVKSFAPVAIGAKDADAVAEFEGSLVRMKPEIVLECTLLVYNSARSGPAYRPMRPLPWAPKFWGPIIFFPFNISMYILFFLVFPPALLLLSFHSRFNLLCFSFVSHLCESISLRSQFEISR